MFLLWLKFDYSFFDSVKAFTERSFTMNKLDTLHPTEVYSDYLVDPSIMDSIFEDTGEKKKGSILWLYRYKSSYKFHQGYFFGVPCDEWLQT